MLGHPKYKYKDIVRFNAVNFEDWMHRREPREADCIGEIEIVDAYGTLEQDEEVSYDILIPGVVLVKHVVESRIIELIKSYED